MTTYGKITSGRRGSTCTWGPAIPSEAEARMGCGPYAALKRRSSTLQRGTLQHATQGPPGTAG